MPIHLEIPSFTFIMSQILQSYLQNVQSYYVRVCCAIEQLLSVCLCLVWYCIGELSSLHAELPW